MPYLTLAQIALLIAWYSVAPTLPWWVVFLPGLIAGGWAFVLLVAFFVALVIAATKK